MTSSANKFRIAFFLGTYEDWGGASRALLNFIRTIDRDRFEPVVILTKEGGLSRQLAEEGITTQIWDIHDRSKNLVAYAAWIYAATRMLKSHAVDLVHMNYGAVGWKPAEILAARMVGIPVINHFHTGVRVPSSYIRYTQAIVGVSAYVVNQMESHGVPKHVIHNLSDLTRFSHGRALRADLGFDAKDVVILLAGQMIRAKGVEMFVQAASQVRGEHVRFLLAGPLRDTDGAYTEDEVHALCATDPRIRYLGYRRDAENLYATADIMVMPSQWEEPCAMVLFESAAAGKPVIATATGGTPEILRHDETGYLFERTDQAALVNHLQHLVDDEATRLRLGSRARQLADTQFASAPLHHLQDLYATLIQRRS